MDAVYLVLILIVFLFPARTCAGDPFRNPVFRTDDSASDVMWAGIGLYLVVIVMRLMPVAPIVKSGDVVNGKTVRCLFPSVTDFLKYNMVNGMAYRCGQKTTS
ncbi:MAG: hypothetical protein I3J02_11825 [Prevotella sp.]|nr:hypothetical protein [Prevotella sp.]